MGDPALVQTCPHCGNVVSQPEWSERVTKQQVVHIWRCTVCGRECETRDQDAGREPSTAELADEFLPNLVVE